MRTLIPKKTLAIIGIFLSLITPIAFSGSTKATSSIHLGDVSYELVYDSNSGAEAPAREVAKGNEYYAMIRISSYTPTRNGFVFEGWSKTPNGEAEIHSGDLMTITSNPTYIYAVWSPLESIVSEVLSEETASAEPLGESSVSHESRTYPNSFFLYAMFLSISLFAFGTLLTYRLAKQVVK